VRRRVRWICECSLDERRRSAWWFAPIDTEYWRPAGRDRPGNNARFGIGRNHANGYYVGKERTSDGDLTKRTMVVVQWMTARCRNIGAKGGIGCADQNVAGGIGGLRMHLRCGGRHQKLGQHRKSD